MVEQHRRQTVPAPEPDLDLEDGDHLLDRHAELSVAVCAVALSVIVVVGQKRPVNRRSIKDVGVEEIRKRAPWEHGRALVHLSSLRNILSYGDQK
jgi:hypothetical protein